VVAVDGCGGGSGGVSKVVVMMVMVVRWEPYKSEQGGQGSATHRVEFIADGHTVVVEEGFQATP
jgi:hypothetical protein